MSSDQLLIVGAADGVMSREVTLTVVAFTLWLVVASLASFPRLRRSIVRGVQAARQALADLFPEQESPRDGEVRCAACGYPVPCDQAVISRGEFVHPFCAKRVA